MPDAGRSVKRRQPLSPQSRDGLRASGLIVSENKGWDRGGPFLLAKPYSGNAIIKDPRSLTTIGVVDVNEGFLLKKFGGHGVAGNTPVCGAGIRGSSPLAHPKERKNDRRNTTINICS